MIESKLLEKAQAESLYKENNLKFKEKSEAMVLVDKGEILGFCLFFIDGGKITIEAINPENDIMICDGVLRSSLFIAANRGIMEAERTNNVSGSIIKKLGFSENEQNHSIDITNLFSSCKNCKKD